MSAPDLEACKSFVYANRIIAERFKGKAEEVLQAALTVESPESRSLLADLGRTAKERAKVHEALASLQERDMGIRCHCPSAEAAAKAEPSNGRVM